MTDPPAGIYPILYAFYDRSGGLDRDAMRRQVECCVAAGAQGIAVLGLITEVGRLTVAAREQVLTIVAGAPVGFGGYELARVVEQSGELCQEHSEDREAQALAVTRTKTSDFRKSLVTHQDPGTS